MKPMQTNQKSNLNMQPMQQTSATKPKYATNAGRVGGRNQLMLGGERAEPMPAGGRAGKRISERVKFSTFTLVIIICNVMLALSVCRSGAPLKPLCLFVRG